MDNVIDSRYYKESLFKTFIRGFVGGLGSVFGFIIGWTLLALILIELNRRYMILPKLQTYLHRLSARLPMINYKNKLIC